MLSQKASRGEREAELSASHLAVDNESVHQKTQHLEKKSSFLFFSSTGSQYRLGQARGPQTTVSGPRPTAHEETEEQISYLSITEKITFQKRMLHNTRAL